MVLSCTQMVQIMMLRLKLGVLRGSTLTTAVDLFADLFVVIGYLFQGIWETL